MGAGPQGQGTLEKRASRTRVEAGARAERTLSMELMSVTLDVLKLSSWLNAYAPCRVETKQMQRPTCGPGDGRVWGDVRCKQRAGKNQLELRARAREERTSNMKLMSVTLDVSKLNGWLKLKAPCRVGKNK